MEVLRSDVLIILEKLKESRENAHIEEYRTLSNSLATVVEMIGDVSRDKEDVRFFAKLQKSLNEEIVKLEIMKSSYLNNNDYKQYYKAIHSYKDLHRSIKYTEKSMRKYMTSSAITQLRKNLK